jgi:Restriction endonuclease S subunits
MSSNKGACKIRFFAKDWEICTLNNSLTLLKDGSHNPPKRVSEGIRFIAGASNIKHLDIDFSGCTYITKEDYDKIHKYYQIVPHDILLTIVGTIGNAAIVKESDLPFSLQRSIAILRCNEDFYYKYMFYWLTSAPFKKQLLSRSNSTAQPGIYLGELSKLLVLKPTVEEQHKIASILSKVDEQISFTESIIEKTEEQKKGLMQQLFAKGIGHSKFKKTEVGEIPVEWDVKIIDDIKSTERSSIAMGPFGSNITADNFVPSGVPVIRGLNLTDVYLVESEFVYLSEDKADELSTSNAFPDDIVITHRGTIGQVSIIPQNSQYSRYVVSQSQMKLKCDKSIVSPYFVNFFLNSTKGQYLLLRNKAGSGVPAIGQPTSSLKKVPIPIPPLDEQKKIVEIISGVYTQITHNKNYLSHLQELKKGLMQDLLTGKVRVKVE